MRNGHKAFIKQALDKKFADAFFQQAYYKNVVFVPTTTVFFYEFITQAVTFQKLGYPDSINLVMTDLEDIRDTSRDAFEQGFLALSDGTKNKYNYLLPNYYEILIEEQSYTLDYIIQKERNFLNYTDEEVCDTMALFQACKMLEKEYSKELKQIEGIYSKNELKTWNRNRQVLFFHYLFKLDGVDRNSTDVTKCASLIIEFLDITLEGLVSNSDIYKKLINPFTQTSKETTIKNLKFVKSHFEQINSKITPQAIQKDIDRLQKD